jgi:hypothetical protein
MNMTKTILATAILGTMVGCASGPETRTMPASFDVQSVCVVDNASLSASVQGLVHQSIQNLGIESHPVGTPLVAEKFGCDAYAIYGGQMEWDMGDFLAEFRFTLYSVETDIQVGYAESGISDWSVKKWGSMDEMVQQTITSVLL